MRLHDLKNKQTIMATKRNGKKKKKKKNPCGEGYKYVKLKGDKRRNYGCVEIKKTYDQPPKELEDESYPE